MWGWLKGPDRWSRLAGDVAEKGWLAYGGDNFQRREKATIIPLYQIGRMCKKIFYEVCLLYIDPGNQSLPASHVIDVEKLPMPDIEPPVANNRMGPALALAALGNLEGADEFEHLR